MWTKNSSVIIFAMLKGERLIIIAEVEPVPKTVLIFQGLSRPPQNGEGFEQTSRLYRISPAARRVRDEAQIILGIPALTIKKNNYEKLQEQGIYLTADFVNMLALLEAVKEARPDFRADHIAYHSQGNFAAMEAAGCIGRTQTLYLAKKHEECLLEANKQNPGGLIALARDWSQLLIEEFGLEIAAILSGDKVVIGGTLRNLDAARARLRKEKVGFIDLNLGGAFHTSLMEPAQEKFFGIISGIDIKAPQIPLTSNIDNRRSLITAVQVREEAVKQITATLQQPSIGNFDENALVVEISGKGLTIRNKIKEKILTKKVTLTSAATIAAAFAGIYLWRRHQHLDKSKN